MKVINPVGRKAENDFVANSARACACGTLPGQFSYANTTADTCSHCGCNCYDEPGEISRFSNGNQYWARTTWRASE